MLKLTPKMIEVLGSVGNAQAYTNVRCEVSPTEQSFTDFNTVYIAPQKPPWGKGHDYWVEKKMIRDHEYAHLKFTGLDAWVAYKKANDSVYPASVDILNIIEDARVERAWGLEYPGTVGSFAYVNINNAAHYIKASPNATGPVGLLNAILCYAKSGIVDPRLTGSELGVLKKSVPYIDAGRLASSTEEAIPHVNEIVKIFRALFPHHTAEHRTVPNPGTSKCPEKARSGDNNTYRQPPPEIEPEPEDKKPENSGDDKDSSKKPKNSGDDDGSGKEPEKPGDDGGSSKKPEEPEEESSGSGSKSESSGDDKDSSKKPEEPGDDGDSSGEPGDTCGNPNPKIESDDLVHKKLAELAKDLRKTAKAELREIAKKQRDADEKKKSGALHDGIKLHEEILSTRRESYMTKHYAVSCLAAAKRLSQSIREILLVKSNAPLKNLKKGRPDSARLWRLPVCGDTAVFKKPARDTSKSDTVVLILADRSGSMGTCVDGSVAKVEHAAHALYISSMACTLSGCLDHAVVSFTTGPNIVRHAWHKGFGPVEKLNLDTFVPDAENRDGLSIRWAAQQLQARPEKRKLLLVISDGLPSHVMQVSHATNKYGGTTACEDTAAAVREAQQRGVTVVGIFFGPSSHKDRVVGMYQNLVCCDPQELPKVLPAVIKRAIAR